MDGLIDGLHIVGYKILYTGKGGTDRCCGQIAVTRRAFLILLANYFIIGSLELLEESLVSLPDHDKGLIIINEGYLPLVRQQASPYCDVRPCSNDISLLVIHGISLPPGCFGGNAIDALFCGQLEGNGDPRLSALSGLRVSAHLLIRRDGEITQYVSFLRRAWHAGQSSFDGRQACNDYSIGIELEGCDDLAYEDSQYQQLVRVSRALMAAYPAINKDRIVAHSEIAPGRKTDPGPAFDWQRYFRLLAVSAS